MQVGLSTSSPVSRHGAARGLRRSLPTLALACSLLLAFALLDARPAVAANRRAKVHASAPAKKPAKAKKGRRSQVKAVLTPLDDGQPHVPPPPPEVASPPGQAPAVHPTAPAVTRPAAVALPAAATPAAAVTLPHAATATHAAALAVTAHKPANAKPVVAPAVALPADLTPIELPRAATPPRAVDLPSGATLSAQKPQAVGLPRAATPTATKAKNAGPVATAWTLPQVPQEKLRSDVRFESIKRMVQASLFAEALAEVNALLEKAPNDEELLAQRARLLFWLARNDEAREALTPLLARHPEDAELRELDAQLKLVEGDKAGALAQYRALELAGDGRVELHQRIIDLSLELEETEAVTKALKFGGALDPEQEMTYVRQVHPWFADVAGTTTLHSGVAWWRGDVSLGRRFNKRWSANFGGVFEQRYSGADQQRATSVKGELYFGFSRIDGMIHLESSPIPKFLPVFDGRAELAVSIVKEFSLGLYGRFADYLAVLAAHAPAARAWTLAPNAIFYVGEWTLQPGYMLMNLAGNTTSATTYFHTGFLKVRWEPDPRWMAFAWFYLGTDPTFIERFGVASPTGATLVLGGEHWWTPRWGTRLSVSRVQPFDTKNDAFSDITLVLRGRL